LRQRLEANAITASGFASYVERVRELNVRRVREGDLDHLIFYLLQSTRFTELPAIDPALSAKAFADGLTASEREAFLRNPETAASRVPRSVRLRIAALLRAVDRSARDARLAYFRALVNTSFPDRRRRDAALVSEYLRVMKFVYEKEFVAQRSARGVDAVVELYRSRGLSTDTAVEAGFMVYQALGVVGSLEPGRHIRRVLIVGPGLDLAPRMALRESGPPESYQPWAIIDALLSLGLSRAPDLEVVAADINPRVVAHLTRARDRPPTLTLVSEIQESDTVTLSEEYRDYFARLGRAIGAVDTGTSSNATKAGPLHRSVRVRPEIARMLRAERLDIVTERLSAPSFDLIIATNILPYFDDAQLMLAMCNIANMLGPEGIFLHNEARALMHDVTTALALPLEQSRHAVIATVRGAPAPLTDSVWLHRRSRGPALPRDHARALSVYMADVRSSVQQINEWSARSTPLSRNRDRRR
jgi:hypothetical protein